MMLNVIMPMAGGGSRFKETEYKKPKPMIDVAGVPMFGRVIENLAIPAPARIILICLNELLNEYGNVIASICKAHFGNYIVLPLPGITQGAACTVLATAEHIDNDDELLIVNCDQLVLQCDYIKNALDYWRKYKVDGGILCIFGREKSFSYARLNDNGYVIETAEKQSISDFATAGTYYYKHGRDFVSGAKKMIENDDRVNNEFYVAPVYNYLIKSGAKVMPYLVNDLYVLGTPEQLKIYERRQK